MHPATDGPPPQGPDSRRIDVELRRCQTDLRGVSSGSAAREKSRLAPPPPLPTDLPSAIEEIEKLRRELTAALTSRKSLERMFSSLGKEKHMIAAELARKVQEIAGLEELVSDLRSQNEALSDKLLKAKNEKGCDIGGETAVVERNRVLSEQLLKSLDSYRSAKKRYKESQEENSKLQVKEAEMAEEAAVIAQSLRDVRQRMDMAAEGSSGGLCVEMEKIERMLVGFQTKLCMKSSSRKPPKVDELDSEK